MKYLFYQKHFFCWKRILRAGIAVIISCFIMPFILFSQAPTITWNKTLGGTLRDGFDFASNLGTSSLLQKTHNGGYIFGGSSNSNSSEDKTENCKGGSDYWVVKLDANGNKIWDKTIGGNYDDELESIQQTIDGGYILGGFSSSSASGDKTENNKGAYDYWVVKLDANGNKIWDKTIGGNSIDILFSLEQASDGGFILGGHSESPMSGDKTEGNKGGTDYWVVKLDANGNKVWDKAFGGSSQDVLRSLQQTSDGGFILGGHSVSPISGDKTEDTRGEYDYWTVKLDANGNKVWDKTFGGSNDDLLTSLQQTTDGGFILGGCSYSSISGDKTENIKGQGDYWVVKLDANGNKVWDKTFGGSQFDDLYSLKQTIDAGFILGGYSYSTISGDKTENSKGGSDYWVVKLDANGNKVWDKTLGGNTLDNLYSIQQADDGSYILGGSSDSPASADKTENSKGGFDYWIVRLSPESNCLSTTLAVSIPDAYAINPGGNVNTIYIGYQPASSITLTATPSGGNAPYSYNWATVPSQSTQQITVSPTITGTYNYNVTVTDGSGCTAQFSKTITALNIISGQNLDKVYICHRDLKGKWTTLSVLQGSVANHLAHGDYLGICNNNSSNSEILTRVASETGGQEIIQKGFKLYPNPAIHFLDVQWTTKNTSQTSIRILNAEGKTVKTITTQGAVNQQRISLNGLAKGVYMLVLKTGSDQQVSKFVIQ